MYSDRYLSSIYTSKQFMYVAIHIDKRQWDAIDFARLNFGMSVEVTLFLVASALPHHGTKIALGHPGVLTPTKRRQETEANALTISSLDKTLLARPYMERPNNAAVPARQHLMSRKNEPG
jgi:hypothetical protein